MKNVARFFLIPLWLCCLLAACSQQTLKLDEPVADSAVLALQARVADYNEWDLQMRVALRRGKWSWRGTMQWMRRADGFRMIFNDLLGRRLMLIESRTDGSVIAVDSKGRSEEASDAVVLIKSMLGIEVPIDSLDYWLLGAPVPNKIYSKLAFNAQGQLQSYEQDDWNINYTAYHQDDCLSGLPSNLKLSQANTQLWLHVNSWQLPTKITKTSTC